jgi:hypothetical protein
VGLPCDPRPSAEAMPNRAAQHGKLLSLAKEPLSSKTVHLALSVGHREFRIPSMNASTALEHPNVVLMSPNVAESLRRSKTAPGVEQLVPKRDRHLAIGALDSPGGH